MHAEMLSVSIAADLGAPDAAASLPPGPGASDRRAKNNRRQRRPRCGISERERRGFVRANCIICE